MASRMKRYVVTEPFSISYEGGKQTVEVGPGDIVDFDGVNFEVGDIRGASSALKTVVREGEWVQREDEDEEAEDPELRSRPKVTPARTYNAMGGVQVEQSDAAVERDHYKGRTASSRRVDTDDLGQIVRDYEEKSYAGKETQVTDDMADIEAESGVERADPRVARQVSQKTKDAAESSDGAIALREAIDEKHLPVEEGQRVVKRTTAAAPPEQPAERKRLVVEGDAGGVEVAKVTDRSPKAQAAKNATDRRKVVQQNTVVKKASTPASKKGVVSSPNSPHIEVIGNPEAQVVAKVTRRPEEKMSKGGMTSTLTSGSADDADSIELADVSSGSDIDVSDLL